MPKVSNWFIFLKWDANEEKASKPGEGSFSVNPLAGLIGQLQSDGSRGGMVAAQDIMYTMDSSPTMRISETRNLSGSNASGANQDPAEERQSDSDIK